MRVVVTDTGGVTATVYIGGCYEQTGTQSRSYYSLGGKRLAMRDESHHIWFLLGDHLGSTSVAYRDDGSETTTQRYYAWGAVRPGPGNGLPTDYTYTGQRVVESVGLLYYGARWYDVQLGRFCQADTVVPQPGNPQDLNRFTYVRNNPVRLVDPTGHAGEPGPGDPGIDWETEWWWQNRWYMAHGYGWDEKAKAWSKDIIPWFTDRGIIDEVLSEARVRLDDGWFFGKSPLPGWTDERAAQVARAVALWGRALAGGVRALAGLFNNETVTVFAGDSPPECLGCPCAPPSSVSNGNSVYVPESAFTGWGSELYVVIVHELAHIVDWHSSVVDGRAYSVAWGNRTPLTDYARTGTQPWDRFAEAATFYVLGRGTGTPERGVNFDERSHQMIDMRRLLEHWE